MSYQSSRDLILAVDLSDSMRTQDMLDQGEQKDRLSAVRQQIDRLIAARPGDRIALIVFADHAYLLSPLTQETDALLGLTHELDFELVGRTTALGEAILLARQQKAPERSTALLLVTDGRNTAGSADPLREAKQAAAAGIRLYTLGVGADPDTFAEAMTPRRPRPRATPVPNWTKPSCSNWPRWAMAVTFGRAPRGISRPSIRRWIPWSPSPPRRPAIAPIRSSTPGRWRWPGCC